MAYEKVVPVSTFKTIKWSQDPNKKGEYVGKSIEGYLLSTEERVDPKNDSIIKIYLIRLIFPLDKAGEEYSVWGTKILNELMTVVLPGERIKITNLGKPTGKNYYQFDLERDSSDVIEVKSKDDQAF